LARLARAKIKQLLRHEHRCWCASIPSGIGPHNAGKTGIGPGKRRTAHHDADHGIA
jgi:hypothetical protein